MEPANTDFRWLSDHPRELYERYRGKWLAIVDERIVATGDGADTVYRQARHEHPDARILLEHVEREPTNPIYELVHS